MMDDEWIVELVKRCEAVVGYKLGQIRGNLSSNEWLSAIWELILLDAAATLGSVTYEPPTGSGRPDLQLVSHSGDRLYIEAAFLRAEHRGRVQKVDDHPVFYALKNKHSAAKRADAKDPYVVFLGTDRVFDIASSRHTDGIGIEEAVVKAFAHRSLSAVVLVSIFARPEIFKPLQKRPRPLLYANPSSRMPLTDKIVDVINRFDFERWPSTGASVETRSVPSSVNHSPSIATPEIAKSPNSRHHSGLHKTMEPYLTHAGRTFGVFIASGSLQ
jgi:hypothetical protein